MAEWLEVQDRTNSTHIAMIGGYAVTVIGSNGLWSWFIDQNECPVTEGVARDLATAVAAAADEARWLAGDPEPGSGGCHGD